MENKRAELCKLLGLAPDYPLEWNDEEVSWYLTLAKTDLIDQIPLPTWSVPGNPLFKVFGIPK